MTQRDNIVVHKYVIGAFLRGRAREFFKAQKFLNHIEDWEEEKGFLDSIFYIKAPNSFKIILTQ